jgi:hypothetical protein
MMYSLYSQRVYNGTEDILEFAAALAAETDRKRGLRLPAHTDNLMGCFYQDAARYTPQVQRYLDVFGRHSVHIIILDDLQADPGRVYRDTCVFLGVDPEFEPDFRLVNQNRRVRSRRLRDVIRFASPTFRALVRATIPRARTRQQLKCRLKSLNTEYIPRPPLDPHLRRRLQAEFLPEVEQLSALLGRDLTHWCTS